MAYYGLLVLLVSQALLVDGKTFIIRKDWIRDCEYKGYVPGGGVTEVGKITAPTATLAKNGIAGVMGKAEDALTAAGATLTVAHEIFDLFSKTAPTLGPVLGIFGAATGVFKSLTDVTPDDILGACNEAMGSLTKDINDKLQRMEGYVKSQIIALEKNLINREYRVVYNLWTNCVKEATIDLSNECQREAVATISAYRPKFAVFAWKLNANTPLTGLEAREVEAYLPIFRAYANLVMMMLKPLIKTYEKDTSAAGRRHFQRYYNQLQEEVAFFAKYSKQAVKAIKVAHMGPGDGVCRKTVDCGPMHQIKEGWGIKVHTANWAECNCVIEEGTQQLCKLHMTIRKDGKKPGGYYVFPYNHCNTDECAANEYTGRLLTEQARSYQWKNREVMNAYWDVELLSFIPVWEQGFRNVLQDEPQAFDEPLDEPLDDAPFHFSQRYKARMRAASAKKWGWQK